MPVQLRLIRLENHNSNIKILPSSGAGLWFFEQGKNMRRALAFFLVSIIIFIPVLIAEVLFHAGFSE
jgi:hypothetical protein